ncbi:MAG TPA: lipopolysaccharide transport periplasmic protein LptA [Burkholderiales bacterium]|nr:lipopolysaccharide transport periplasmic protein LptA [Burkholderiales bacterium]
MAAFVLAAALLGMPGPPAHAEKADRDKPVNIESDRMNANDAKKTAVFDGKVVLTQGTMTIRAERIIVVQDAQGFQSGTAIGSPATFRQKREGVNEYIEAEAERIEYNGRADKVEFFNRARLRRDCGDDVRGGYISYDSRSEFFTVNSAGANASNTSNAQGTQAPKPAGRVSAVLMPKTPSADPASPCPGVKPAAEAGRGQ